MTSGRPRHRYLRTLTAALAATLLTAACGSGGNADEPTRNITIPPTTKPIPRPTVPRVQPVVPPTVATTVDPDEPTPAQLTAIEEASGGQPLVPPGAREDPFDCYDAVRTVLQAGKIPVGYIELFHQYLDSADPGPFDCDDPGEHVPGFLAWLSKLIPTETPKPGLALRADSARVDRARSTVTWRVNIAPDFPVVAGDGFIYAHSIVNDASAPGRRRGNVWHFDRFEFSTATCNGGAWSNWRAMSASTFENVVVRLDRYRPEGPEQCLRARVRVPGTENDGSPSRHIPLSDEQLVKLPDVPSDRLNDPFVLIGFGDSYGSGEGNPYMKGEADEDFYEDCLDELEDEVSSEARCDNGFWWDPDVLSRHGVNTTSLANVGACHRSSESGLSKAVRSRVDTYSGEVIYSHFACSGAVSSNLWRERYEPGFWDDPTVVPVQITEALQWLPTVNRTPSEVDAVVVSIGGNDVGFSDVIYECFIEAGDCNDEDDTRYLYNSIARRIPNAINEVVVAVRSNFPNAVVYFTNYTDGISVNSRSSYDEDGDGVCSYDDDPWFTDVPYDDDEFWDILPEDAAFVRDFLVQINRTMVSTVQSINRQGARLPAVAYIGFSSMVYTDTSRPHGIGATRVITSQFDNYRNNGFCTRDRRNIVFNDEAINNQGADQWWAWSSGGWHPNNNGYNYYAEGISAALIRDFSGQEYLNLSTRR